jgi:O-acetyl-ADP-ribose deacetylase (regulator of RNase III)
VIHVAVDDLAFRPSDAIVRPATARLDPTTPMVRRLEEIGGTEFQRHLTLHKDLAVGAAVVTGGGGALAAEFVIHAVIQSEQEPVSHGAVARAWLSTLQRAREWGFARLTVPPLGTGAGNLSLEDAAEIMVGVLTAQLGQTDFPLDVCFVVESDAERAVFESAVRRQAAELS